MKSKNYVKKRPYAFRQWTRKPYAVFNSLKLSIKISVMCVAYTLINPVQESKAQTDSTQIATQHELDEVEVSGQRAPVVHSQMARVVSVITRSEIEQAPAFCFNDLLKSIPQVDVRQRGANGVQADVSIQGGSFDQTLILLNGVNFTDPQTGHHNLNLPLDLSSIDRVEVLKGPASRVFGANAFSGAINFVTGLETSNYIKTSQILGDFGLYQGSISVNQHSEKFHNFISVSKSQSNGYIHNTNYDSKNLFYHGKALLKLGTIGYQLGYTTKEFGANGFYSPKYLDQYEFTDTYLASINGETTIAKVKFSPVVYWRRNYDHYILIHGNPKIYQNFHFTDIYGAGLNATLTSSVGKTSLGIEYRKELVYSNSLGNTLTETKKIPGQDSLRYTMGNWRENLSFYAEQNIYLGQFSASAGIMANRNTKLDKIELYPGIDMGYQFIKPIKWYSSVNRSLRLPTFTDLYYNGPQNLGNPDLIAENAWTIETGFKYQSSLVSGNVSYFHRWAVNYIDWIWKSDIQKWHTENIPKVITGGIEIMANIKPQALFSANFPVKKIIISYTFNTQNKNSNDSLSFYSLDIIKSKLTVGTMHTIYKNLGASWQLTYLNRNGMYQHYDPVTKILSRTGDTKFSAYWVMDGKLFYKTNFVNFFMEATNIFNRPNYDFGNLLQPGRWFKIGVEVKVGWK